MSGVLAVTDPRLVRQAVALATAEARSALDVLDECSDDREAAALRLQVVYFLKWLRAVVQICDDVIDGKTQASEGMALVERLIVQRMAFMREAQAERARILADQVIEKKRRRARRLTNSQPGLQPPAGEQ